MILGMDNHEATAFIERISAVAIVNQAALRCIALSLPLTADNVILLVGDFFDPDNPEFAGLINEILLQVDVVVRQPMPIAAQ